jgi:peptide/nickel transport system substrate-binding protein
MTIRTSIRGALAVLLFAGLAAPVAGCGSGATTSGGGSPASGVPAKDQKLRILAAEPQSGLDPTTAVTDASRRMMELVYDNLLDYDPQGKLVPDLAERWDASPDGKAYTFHLRTNAKFSDGSKLTADDVKWSLERSAKGEALKASLKVVDAITVVDPATVRVTLATPSRVFLDALARVGSSAILSQKAVEAGGSSYFAKPTATSGPWMLQDYRSKDRATLKANPHYWKTGFPKITDITYTFSSDPTSAAAALDSGTADMYFPMAPSDAQRLQKSGRIKYYAPPQPGVLIWGLDKTKPPFDDVRVRQAFAYMAPRDDRVQACWKGIGGVSYGSLILPGSWASSDGLNRYKVTKEEALATAGKLLDEAGWKGTGVRKAQGVKGVPDGTSLSVAVPFENNWDQARCNTQLLQSALKPAGIDIKPQAYDAASFWADVGKGKFRMYHGGAGWATVDEMMLQGFTSDGQLNSIIARWSNKKFDELVAKAQATSDLNEAKDLYAQAQKIFQDEQPVIDTGAQYSVVGATTKLQGFSGRSDVSNRALIEASLTN